MKTLFALVLAAGLVGCGNTNTSYLLDDEDPVYTIDNCLGDQDMNAEDVDIANCPQLLELPEDAPLGDTEEMISLGAWELGETAEGLVYKYGLLSEVGEEPRRLNFYEEEEFTVVNQGNLDCWAKGYYRLRKILQTPPESYVTLRDAGFQVRFFQFQTDLRNGPTGFREISSYRDHLVKWVTVIDEEGTCVQPTLAKFEAYVEAELIRREL